MAATTETMMLGGQELLDYDSSVSEIDSLPETDDDDECWSHSSRGSPTPRKERVKLEDSATFPVDESEGEIEEASLVESSYDSSNSVVDSEELEDTLKKIPKKKIAVPPMLEGLEAGDSEEIQKVKELLQEWDGPAPEMDEDELSDDSSFERQVILKDNVVDHIVLAAPDMDNAIDEFERMTGVAPVEVHSVNGLGIKTAQVSFNDSSYIEIIAPDHKGAPGPIGLLLKSRKFKKLTPFHYALRTSQIAQLKKDVTAFGYNPDHISMYSGKMDCEPHKWETMYMYGHKMAGICPYFVHWEDASVHPCTNGKIPVVGKLKKLHIRAPADDPVHRLFEHVQAEGFCIERGDKPRMSFQFSCPDGTCKFASSKPVGFKFPGFDDSQNLSVNDSQVFSDSELDWDESSPSLAPDLLSVADDHEAVPAPSDETPDDLD